MASTWCSRAVVRVTPCWRSTRPGTLPITCAWCCWKTALLFSGDHVLNGSTTVVDPPDGDMSAYIDSLDLLAAACRTHAIEFILPAHGYVLGFAEHAIAHLKAHRLHREAKVMAAMQARPDGNMDEWVELVYDDVPPRMWPLAKRSLLAHVQRIEALGMATHEPPRP